MIDIDVSIEIGPADRMLTALQGAVLDLREPFTDVVDPLVSQFFTDQFATAGAAGGTPWAPLRPSTLAFKDRWNRAGMGILRFFNRLWASLTKSGGPDGIRVIEKDRHVRGTSVPYAQYHQTGYIVSRWGRAVFRSPVHVPPRPLIPDPLPSSLVTRIQDAIAAHLTRVAEGSAE